MSVNFYLEKGYTPQNKTVTLSGVGTFTLWAPTTSTRIALTNLSISNNAAGTIAFYWGNLAGSKIAEFLLSASGNISPAIGIWEGTMYDRSIFGKGGGAVGTDGIRVNVTGFEIPFF